MNSLYHDLSLTLRPVNVLSVTPSLSSGVDRYEWSSTRYQFGSASLLLTYTPPASRFSLWTLGAYTTSESTDTLQVGASNVGRPTTIYRGIMPSAPARSTRRFRVLRGELNSTKVSTGYL